MKIVILFQTVLDEKVVEVQIDKGMIDGQKIVFSSEGNQEPGLEAGDIIFILEEQEHAVFK